MDLKCVSWAVAVAGGHRAGVRADRRLHSSPYPGKLSNCAGCPGEISPGERSAKLVHARCHPMPRTVRQTAERIPGAGPSELLPQTGRNRGLRSQWKDPCLQEISGMAPGGEVMQLGITAEEVSGTAGGRSVQLFKNLFWTRVLSHLL